MTERDALSLAAGRGIDVRGAVARELQGGWTNQTFRVDAGAGRYVVRRYGRTCVTRNEVLFEHAVLAHAAQRTAQVVAPLPDGDGQTLAQAPDGGMAAVFPYVDGDTGRRDLATACAAASALARFHAAMRDMRVARGAPSARGTSTLSWLCKGFAAFATAPATARALDWDALIVATTTAGTRWARHAEVLPVVVIHGDLNADNIVSARPGVVNGLIDFDATHETERVYDLGAFLDEHARDRETAPLDHARIAPLIAAYAEEAPIAPAERDLVPEAMLRRAATLVRYVATRHGERVPGDIGGASRYAARVAEIAAQLDAIREAAHG